MRLHSQPCTQSDYGQDGINSFFAEEEWLCEVSAIKTGLR